MKILSLVLCWLPYVYMAPAQAENTVASNESLEEHEGNGCSNYSRRC